MRLRSLSILICSFVLTACTTDEATSLVERYASRTSNAIEIDFELELKPTAQVYSTLAPRRERLASVPEIREGLLELLDLRHCNLMQLVSERNTSLGRVAKPSQRLIYELKILPRLQQCIDSLDADPEQADLRQKLQEFVQIKQSGFAPLVFNALYNTDEMEQHFSLGKAALTPGDQGYLAPLTASLERFGIVSGLVPQERWSTPSFAQSLETDFETLYRTDFGARWISSMALLTQTLNQTSLAIEQRLAGRPICFNRKRNTQSEILWNVFLKFYVGELQPYIAQVEREGREWSRLNSTILLPLYEISESRLITALFDTGSDSPIWGPYISARERHTEAWQTLLEQCDLRPGA